jgi:hypothetical protein
MTKDRSYIIYGETVHLATAVPRYKFDSLAIFLALLTQDQDKEKVEWVQAISKAIVQARSNMFLRRKCACAYASDYLTLRIRATAPGCKSITVIETVNAIF